MYNKLFSRILTSSIWTQDYPTRIVWVTFLAAMDEDGFAHFATARNVAAVAQVTPAEAEAAIAVLEGPDPHSSNPANEGRRIERMPGGWLILNAAVYRSMQRRRDARDVTAARMRRYRDRKRDGSVTAVSDAIVTPVTAHTEAEAYTDKRSRSSRGDDLGAEGFAIFWSAYPRKVAKAAALKAWLKIRPDADLQALISKGLDGARRSEQWQRDGGAFIPHPATWLNGRRWEDDLTPAPLAVVADGAVEAERRRAAQLLADMRAKDAAAAKRRQEGGAA